MKKDTSRMLRVALRLNATSSILFGALYALLPVPVARFFGDIAPRGAFSEGIFLLLFAAWLLRLSFRDSMPRWQVVVIIALDLLGVAGYAGRVLAPADSMTYLGKVSLLLIADMVALFAILQILGLRKMLKARADSSPA